MPASKHIACGPPSEFAAGKPIYPCPVSHFQVENAATRKFKAELLRAKYKEDSGDELSFQPFGYNKSEGVVPFGKDYVAFPAKNLEMGEGTWKLGFRILEIIDGKEVDLHKRFDTNSIWIDESVRLDNNGHPKRKDKIFKNEEDALDELGLLRGHRRGETYQNGFDPDNTSWEAKHMIQ